MFTATLILVFGKPVKLVSHSKIGETCAMDTLIRGLLCILLLWQSASVSMASPQQEASKKVEAGTASFDPKSTLEDGTPVKLRISQTVSSADAHLNDRVEFEVLDDIRVADTLIIPKGGIAWGTVTEAQPKRRMGRGGKLEIVMDSVRLVDGEKAALRATKEVQGGGHVGAMTTGIVVTGLLFFPAAPLFLFMHGKDITIPKGTEVPTFINGNFVLNMAKFKQAAPAQSATETQASNNAEIAVSSSPPGADIELDGTFVGSTPSTIGVTAGDHTVTLKKSGFTIWERKIKVSGGTIQISADLQASEGTPTQPAQ
jgi:PEGA domain